MLKIFKRSDTTVASAAPRPTPRESSSTHSKWQGLYDPLPMPEVREGNADADWALWEDCVSRQNRQMQLVGSGT